MSYGKDCKGRSLGGDEGGTEPWKEVLRLCPGRTTANFPTNERLSASPDRNINGKGGEGEETQRGELAMNFGEKISGEPDSTPGLSQL